MRTILMLLITCAVWGASQEEANEIWRKAMEESAQVEAKRQKEREERERASAIRVLTPEEVVLQDDAKRAAAEANKQERMAKINADFKEKYGIDPSLMPSSSLAWGEPVGPIPEHWRDAYFQYLPANKSEASRVKLAATFTLDRNTVRVQTDTGEFTLQAGRVYEVKGEAVAGLWLPDVLQVKGSPRGLLLMRNQAITLQFPGYSPDGSLEYSRLIPYMVGTDLSQ